MANQAFKYESRKRWDICPACTPKELERLALVEKEKHDRRAARDQARIDRRNGVTPKRKRPRAAAAQEASASP